MRSVRLLIALASALAMATFAAPAFAANAWSPPQIVSEDEASASVPQVQIADDGSAVAVWVLGDPVSHLSRLQYSTRVRGGNFTVPANLQERAKTFISPTGQDVNNNFSLAMDSAGHAIVVWQAPVQVGNTTKQMIFSSYKPVGGTFGAPQLVVGANSTSGPNYIDPQVGIDDNAQATVIYHTPPASFNNWTSPASVWNSQDRPGGTNGTWGNVQPLIFHDYGTDAQPNHYNERSAALSVGSDGSRRAALVSQAFMHDGQVHQNVYEVARNNGASFWSTVGPSTFNFTGYPCCNDTDEDILPQVVDRPNGTIVAWTHSNTLEASYDDYQADSSPEQINVNGMNAPTPTSGQAFDVDNYGLGNALWSDGTSLRANQAEGFGFFRPDPTPVAGADPGVTRTNPSLDRDLHGNQLAVYAQVENVDDNDVQAALRGPGGTTKYDVPMKDVHADGTTATGAPVTISAEKSDVEVPTPDGAKPTAGPKVAMNADGEAVATWAQKDENGYRVHLSLLGPEDDVKIPPPPPPPPPPPAPQPNPIKLARPMQRDQAVVLYANLTNPADRIDWSFGTKDEPPITAGVVNGELQTAVRVRVPTEDFTAKVTVYNLDGSIKVYSRSFSQPKPSNSEESKTVRKALDKTNTPPVFAVGDRATLVGNDSSALAKDAGCTPTTIFSAKQKLSGCFKPIESVADIPGPESGAVKQLGDTLGINEANKALMQKATDLTNGYVGQGQAMINDEFPVTPKGPADLVSIPEAKALISARAELPVGNATFDPKNGFNLKIDPKKAEIPLGKLPKPPKLPSLGGLEIVGDWDVDLKKQEATITASLKMPKEISKAGVKFENEIKLRATPTQVIVDHARIGPIDANIGALQVRAFKIEYDRAADEWDGQASACVVKKVCIDMAPPDGGIKISHGRVTFAGASVRFPPPGIELFPGVDLTKIGFGMGFDPTRMIGSGLVSVAQLIGIDGRLVLAFPSGAAPFVLRRDEVGNDFDAGLYGPTFTRPVVGMAGGLSFELPETDETLTFAHGYMLYEFPGYVAAGGRGNLDLLGIIQLDGSLSTAMDIIAKRFNAHGDVHACYFESDVICGGAVANISHGPNKEGGAGACIDLGPVSVGGGVQWARVSEPFLWPIDGCKWSRFKIDVRPSQAGGITQTGIDLKAGDPNPVLKLYGDGAAPLVRISGPSGQLDGSSPEKIDYTADGKIRIMRFDGNADARPFTVIGLDGAAPGHYAIEPLPGSVPITGSAHTHDLPNAKVSGHVRGKGRQRVLHFKVGKRPDQRVTFQEVEPGGPAKTIGSTAKASGQLKWSSGPGLGRHKVFAQFTLAGVPAERKLVTTFKPAPPLLPRPSGIRVSRTKKGLAVSWKKVKDAKKYEVAVAMTSHRMAFAAARKTHALVKHVPRWAGGRVTVRALDDLRQSRPSAARSFRGKGKAPSGLRPLSRCKVKKHKIRWDPLESTCRHASLSIL